jgi:hypothetical protein
MPMIVCEMQIFNSSRGPLRESACLGPQRLFAPVRMRFAVQIRVVFARLDLLRMKSSGSKARRGAAWMWMWPKEKEGWPAQHGARRERREVSLVGGRNYHGGGPGGRGYLGGKINTSKLAMDVIRSMCTPNPKWHPPSPEALVSG